MNTATHEKYFRHGLKVTASLMIRASQSRVIAFYKDYTNWKHLFPATINDAHLIKEENGRQMVEVDHKKAGKVLNILRFPSVQEIELEEFKSLYDALFLNRFDAVENGTVYTVTGFIKIKGILKIVTPFVKGIVRSRIYNYVLLPMKQYAEKK